MGCDQAEQRQLGGGAALISRVGALSSAGCLAGSDELRGAVNEGRANAAECGTRER